MDKETEASTEFLHLMSSTEKIPLLAAVEGVAGLRNYLKKRSGHGFVRGPLPPSPWPSGTQAHHLRSHRGRGDEGASSPLVGED